MDIEKIEKLKEIIDKSKIVVFFGGAGVSTESGIPDFRSEESIQATMKEYGMSPEELLQDSFFMQRPDIFYDYYRKFMLNLDAEPNAAHVALAKLEAKNKVHAVITQNIDGLHRLSGSKSLFEIHGSVMNHYCVKCHKQMELNKVVASKGVPICECGGIVRPDIVLYGESLNEKLLFLAISIIKHADTMIVAGTSLRVHPAAGLLSFFKGDNLVIINKTETDYDGRASLIIRDPIAKVMERCVL